MKFIPILFSTSMVQEILADRKTMTRRVIKKIKITETQRGKINYSGKSFCGVNCDKEDLSKPFIGIVDYCPYGQPGDVLWVRESFRGEKGDFVYKASCDTAWISAWKWKPSIHMPKESCRIFLQIKSIKVEGLQDISEDDAIKEGVQQYPGKKEWIDYVLPGDFFCMTAVESFKSLWEKINGEKSWDENPWVWVIEFEKIVKPENFI